MDPLEQIVEACLPFRGIKTEHAYYPSEDGEDGSLFSHGFLLSYDCEYLQIGIEDWDVYRRQDQKRWVRITNLNDPKSIDVLKKLFKDFFKGGVDDK